MIDHVAYGLLGVLEEIRAVCSDDEIAAHVGNGELLTRGRDETQFGNVRPFLQVKGQGHRHHCFNACAIDFAITLRGMAVATGEQGTGNQDRKEDFCAREKMADVNIASIFAGWDGRKPPGFTRADSHHTAEWFIGNLNILPELTGGLAQFIVLHVRLREVTTQQSEAWDNGVPAPAFMFDADDIDHESIAWFRSLHVHWTGKWMNEAEIQCPGCL